MRKLTFALLLSSLTQIAHASLESEIAVCAAKRGDLDRLECYDGVAKRRRLDGPQVEPSGSVGSGKWKVSTRTNPIDDSKTVTLVLLADSGRSKWDRPIALIIRCRSNTTELYINWNDYLGSEAEVLTRIGSEQAIRKLWPLSTDKQATFHPSGTIEFIKQMMSASKFVAQVTPYNESPVTAIFDTSGLSDAIKPLQDTCNWR